jgi:hypothetical protein
MALISRSDFDLLMDRADEANRGTTGGVAGNGVINPTSAQLFVLAIKHPAFLAEILGAMASFLIIHARANFCAIQIGAGRLGHAAQVLVS